MHEHPDAADPQPPDRDEVNLFVYLQILLKWKRFILINIAIVAVIVAGITLLIPNTYKATASVIPPRQEGGLGGMISQMTKDIVPTNILGRLNVSQGVYNYLAIMQSRRTMEAIIRKFDLWTVYGITSRSMEIAMRNLAGNSFFDIEKNGNITITVIDESPQRAADMANYYVEMLNLVNSELSSLEARNNRLFLERRYQQAQKDMRSVEDSLRLFQEKYGIFSLPDQIKAGIEEVAQLKAQASIGEVELGVLERSLGRDNQATRLKTSEIDEIKRKLRSLKDGTGDGDAAFSLPFKDVPELGIRYLRLYRDFEIQNKILQFIIPMYEQARVDEQKNIPAVLVLDKAYKPERKDGPKRSMIVLVAMLLVGSFSAFLVFVFESLRSTRRTRTSLEMRLIGRIERIVRLYRIRDAQS
jgi:tyrosine-protein kinase Etk/Wzc